MTEGNVRHVNSASDFRVIFSFPENKLPTYPWQIELKTLQTAPYNTYVASFDGSSYNRCIPLDDGSVLVLVDHHNLAPGTLCYTIKRDIPDDLFPDGEMNLTTPGCTSIELWSGPSEELPVEQINTIVATLKGDSAYELFKKHHPECDISEEQYSSLPIKAIEEADSAREQIEKTEAKISIAEELREQSEKERIAAENGREAAEQIRIITETERVNNEMLRTDSEELRAQSELFRVSSEQGRVTSELARVDAEASRVNEEKKRVGNEEERINTFAEAITEVNEAANTAIEAAANLATPLDVLAHSECTLDEHVASVERQLSDTLTGAVLVPELQVRRLVVWGENNLVLTGAGAPAKAPDRAGQFYIDTAARALYFSTGNGAVSDWKNA